jgi:hypothetical protein
MKQRRSHLFRVITVLFSAIAIGVNLRWCTAYRSSPFRYCRGRFSWSQYQNGTYDIGTFVHIDVSRDSIYSTLFSPMSLIMCFDISNITLQFNNLHYHRLKSIRKRQQSPPQRQKNEVDFFAWRCRTTETVIGGNLL